MDYPQQKHILNWDFSKKIVALRLNFLIWRLSRLGVDILSSICALWQWESDLRTMAVFSALKNKKNQKLREGLEDLALKCGEVTEKDEVNVEVGLNNII